MFQAERLGLLATGTAAGTSLLINIQPSLLFGTNGILQITTNGANIRLLPLRIGVTLPQIATIHGDILHINGANINLTPGTHGIKTQTHMTNGTHTQTPGTHGIRTQTPGNNKTKTHGTMMKPQRPSPSKTTLGDGGENILLNERVL